jgi:hypothetical protein
MCWSTASSSVVIVGPVADDPSWLPRSGDGFTKARFQVDSDRHLVTYPAAWISTHLFARKDCMPCSMRSRCTRPKDEPRIIGLNARENYVTPRAIRKGRGRGAHRPGYADHNLSGAGDRTLAAALAHRLWRGLSEADRRPAAGL